METLPSSEPHDPGVGVAHTPRTEPSARSDGISAGGLQSPDKEDVWRARGGTMNILSGNLEPWSDMPKTPGKFCAEFSPRPGRLLLDQWRPQLIRVKTKLNIAADVGVLELALAELVSLCALLGTIDRKLA
ncbi:hypothetical protein RRG08_025955 [Elysia crispata]|uniref:Uncharacterized protein n=1 Tax=Elysia crispata TaxID=231223 RepID=A0AAE0ZGX5_9GAST|nr:hypothetical protein RRG08_025955 [Elysia crispata]